MPPSDEFRDLFYRIFNGQKPKGRELRRVFQFRRYLEWRDLAPEEKLSAKRFLLIPFFAYIIIGFFNQNLSLIILFLIGYALYNKFQRDKIEKK